MTSNGIRLRVLHIGKYFPPHRGGIESHLRDLCSELRKFVDLKVLVANDVFRNNLATVEGVDVVRLARAMTLFSTPICPAMISSIRRDRTDIVHLHLPNPAAAIACLLARPAGALVITWHSDVVRQRRLVRLYQPLERLLLRDCAAIVATSRAYISSSPVLRQHADRCHVIPHGISTDRFDGDRVDRSLVSELRKRFGQRIILSVGRLVLYKGIKFLIQAMATVDAKLLVVGEGPLRRALEQEAARRGVSDRVIFLGEIDGNLASYYHACDVFALPSCDRSEAFGIVQLEAMACGKPVVNTQIDSGVPFASPDGITGITVQPGNPDEIAGALNRLLDNPDLRLRMGRAARARVETEFRLDMMVRRTLDVYAEVSARRLDRRLESNGAAAPKFSSDTAHALHDQMNSDRG